MNPPVTSLAEAQPGPEPRSGLGRIASLPLWARLIMLTAAGLLSLIGSSLFLSSELHQTADRTTRMKELFDVAGVAGEAHVTFGELRYWLTDLSVSLLVTSERSATAAQERLEANLDRLASYDPDTVAAIRSEVAAYVATAFDAADAYTDGNRVIGNTFLASARIHSAKVDEALNALVEKVSAAAFAERRIVVERADGSARAAFYIVVALSLIGLGLTALVFRSIVHPLRRLNDAIAGLMQGRYNVEIPSEGDHEFGAMARTLRLFRENAIERERLEAEAERQRNMISTAIETISDGFVLYDSETRILLANSKYCEMFPEIAPIVRPGVEFKEILQAQLKAGQVVLGDMSPDQWIGQRLARHRDTQDSVDERRYGGTWVRITKRATPDGGKVAVYTDITELKEREAEITRAKDAAEAALAGLQKAQARLVQAEKMASLGQLTAGIAHEIKNPLNFVNNFAKLSDELLGELGEILEEPIKALDAETRDDAEDLLQTIRQNLTKINEHGKRADSIVKNMLLHSREGPSERQTANLNAIADEALSLAYHGARAENPKFNIEIVKALAPEVGEVECFPQDLMRVFLNLINNGMYAAHKRGAQEGDGFAPAISLTTRATGEKIEIEVRDNGSGIPAEVREKIFTPFFTTKPAGEGTGLGLSLSYDIVVKQHGGEMTVDSDPGAFTAFRVTLPRTLPAIDSVQ
jgi:signal transduction histidine kinase